MKPIEFVEQNCVFAKSQPEYKPLPAYKSEDGTVISCWRLTLRERVKLLFTGKIWVGMLMFDKPLTPIFLETRSQFIKR